MLIAQITDLHVMPPGEKLAGLVDTNGLLAAAVEHLNGLSRAPDAVLVTGDLTETGDADAYAVLRERIDAIRAPAYLIPGNHDRREALRSAFPHHPWLGTQGFVQYTVEDLPVRLVALDTLLEGREDGALCAERLQWLEERLAEAPERPTLILMHHPPFDTGIWWMDASGLSGAAALREVVGRHSQVRRIVCGHVHRPIQTAWGAVPISVAPSTGFQVHLDLESETPPRVVLEPPALQLHSFDGESFVTHTAYVGAPQPIDVSAAMGGWTRVREELLARKAALV